MPVRFLAKAKPFGDYPIADTEDIQHGTKRLDAALSDIETVNERKADKTYVDAELAKKADSTTVSALDTRVSTNETNIANQTARIDKLSNYVTPEMFGAKGDGVTDDTAAIKSALLASGNVFLPKGTYKVTSDISTGSRFCGETISRTIIKLTNNAKINISGFGCYIGNFTVKTDSSEEFAIKANYISDSTKIENIRIESPEYGLEISKSWYATINNIRIMLKDSEGKASKTGVPLQLRATSEGGVNNLNFSGIFTHGGEHSIKTVKESTYNNEQIGFYNCTFENCDKTVVKTDGNTQGLLLDTCYLEGVATHATDASIVYGSTEYGCIATLRNILIRTTNDSVPAFIGNTICECCTSNTKAIRDCDDKLTRSNYNQNINSNGYVVKYVNKGEEQENDNIIINNYLYKGFSTEISRDLLKIQFGESSSAKFKIDVFAFVDGYLKVRNSYDVVMSNFGTNDVVITPDSNNNADFLTISYSYSYPSTGYSIVTFTASVQNDSRYKTGYKFYINGWASSENKITKL